MIKYLLLISSLFLLSACVNKNGISLKYYSECEEYYDLQGYYHKDCGKDDFITYKDEVNKDEESMPKNSKSNVW